MGVDASLMASFERVLMRRHGNRFATKAQAERLIAAVNEIESTWLAMALVTKQRPGKRGRSPADGPPRLHGRKG